MSAPSQIAGSIPQQGLDGDVSSIRSVRRGGPHSSAGAEPVRFAGLSANTVLRHVTEALTAVFDLQSDRFVCVGETAALGRLLRSDAPAGDVSDDAPRKTAALPSGRNACALAPSASGLTTALGLYYARTLLRQSHWVVTILSTADLLDHLTHEAIEQWHAVGERFLVIVLDDGRPRPVATSAAATNGATNGGVATNGSATNGVATQYEALDARWLGDLGIEYRGPVVAGDFGTTAAALEQIRRGNRSTLLHLRTEKDDQAASLTRNGETALARGGSWRPDADRGTEIINQVADELARIAGCNARLVTIVEECLAGSFRRDEGFSDRLHVVPAGAAADEEQQLLTWSRGVAEGGGRPVLVSTVGLIQRQLAPIQNELCRRALPFVLVLAADEPADDASAPEGAGMAPSPLAFLRLLSGMAIMSPKDPWELQQMLRMAVERESRTTIVLPRQFSTEVKFSDFAEHLEPGRGEILEEGHDVCLLALGGAVTTAVLAGQRLSARGVSAAVLNARFAQPLDTRLIREYAAQVHGLITLEETPCAGGFGSAVLEFLAESGLATPVAVMAEEVGGTAARRESWIAEVVHRAQGLAAAPARAQPYGPESASTRRSRSPRRERGGQWTGMFDISAEALQRERMLILAQPLSPTVLRWVADYSRVGRRPMYLWQWCQRGVELTTLPCVMPELRQDACDSKVLSIMINVLLDDVADGHGSEVLLEELLQITRGQRPDFSRLSSEEQSYAELTLAVWDEYWARVAEYPNFQTYRELLQYDLSQLFNTIRYSSLLNRNPHLLNMVEHDLYSPHSMMQMSFATVDLGCTGSFPWDGLGKLREAVWHAQCMGRIGNLVTTWQREIPSRDFTSGVFAHAVTAGNLTVGELLHAEPQMIEAAIQRGGHEDHFLKEWKYHLRCLNALRHRFSAFDLGHVIQGLKQLLVTELASRGLK